MTTKAKETQKSQSVLFQPLVLACGVTLKNRLVKSAMSDSLGDGTGHPTDAQLRLYQRWAAGGIAACIVGEVQGNPHSAEKPGNLVLHDKNNDNNRSSNLERFRQLAQWGSENDTLLWLQLGHAGALAYEPTSPSRRGPSALHLPELLFHCDEMTLAEIHALPRQFAATAALAQQAGVDIARDALRAARDLVEGVYVMPPFNRFELAVRVIRDLV